VVIGVFISLSAGVLLVRRPHVRVPISVASCVITVLSWIALLAFGGDHPNKPLVIVLVLVMSVGGPVSSIGFLLARDYNRPANAGTATGVTNVAGFVATISCAAVIGGVLDIAGNTGPGAFRVAFLAALAIPALGTFRMVVWWRRSRADVLKRAEAGQSVPVLVVRRPWDVRLASPEVDPEAAPVDSGATKLADLAQ
jgi:MFS family permease